MPEPPRERQARWWTLLNIKQHEREHLASVEKVAQISMWTDGVESAFPGRYSWKFHTFVVAYSSLVLAFVTSQPRTSLAMDVGICRLSGPPTTRRVVHKGVDGWRGGLERQAWAVGQASVIAGPGCLRLQDLPEALDLRCQVLDRAVVADDVRGDR